MKVLGIETSCDETAIAVLDVKDKNSIQVLANVISSQVKLHAQYGGVVPNLAAREHTKNIGYVLDLAFRSADIASLEKEIDLIAITYGPGLGPALIIGIAFAKALAFKYSRPIIGVNHMEGHIYSNWLTNSGKFEFPVLNLIVSGGHTELVLMRDHCQYELIGETKDDAVGEAFDKVARLLGLGYPGGPAISKLAESGDPDRFPLPSPMIHSKDYNFSYSGLKTAVLYLLRDLGLGVENINDQTKSDIAASFQKSAIGVLIKKTIAAGKEYGVKTILLSGGVSANKQLRQELADAAGKERFNYGQPPLEYTTDNAAMIAVAGYYNWKHLSSHKATKDADWKSVQMDANLGF